MILVDTHVHLYSCHNLEEAFYSAFKNFAQAQAKLSTSGTVTKILCLTESKKYNYFEKLRNKILHLNNYECMPLKNKQFIKVSSKQGDSLLLLSGRQIITQEKVEILGLGYLDLSHDGFPAHQVIKIIRSQSAIPVLPWSPGKWLGRRGKVIFGLLNDAKPGELWVGDINIRPGPCPDPKLFTYAKKRGIPLVAGTDPLPLPGEELSIASYLTVLEGELDMQEPFDAFREALLKPSRIYGERNSFWSASRRLWQNKFRATVRV